MEEENIAETEQMKLSLLLVETLELITLGLKSHLHVTNHHHHHYHQFIILKFILYLTFVLSFRTSYLHMVILSLILLLSINKLLAKEYFWLNNKRNMARKYWLVIKFGFVFNGW